MKTDARSVIEDAAELRRAEANRQKANQERDHTSDEELATVSGHRSGGEDRIAIDRFGAGTSRPAVPHHSHALPLILLLSNGSDRPWRTLHTDRRP